MRSVLQREVPHVDFLEPLTIINNLEYPKQLNIQVALAITQPPMGREDLKSDKRQIATSCLDPGTCKDVRLHLNATICFLQPSQPHVYFRCGVSKVLYLLTASLFILQTQILGLLGKEKFISKWFEKDKATALSNWRTNSLIRSRGIPHVKISIERARALRFIVQ